MSTFFPRQNVEWRLEEPPAFRRLSLSLFGMALLAGVLLRVIRAVTFTAGRASWLFYGVAFVVGLLILLGLTTAHLANWTLRSWLWRAPVFALVETVGEMATSLVLIALQREPEGAVRAEFHDWPSMALRAFLQSELAICLWAALLAGVIIFVRRSGVAEGVEEEPVVDVES
ncbi:MAG TPA: hypothetical protein VFS59_10270 [Gemmatimonadaceae bacterium]|nr:hypothetical protein [Gemmatimonadaceae bacterium]